MYYRVAIKPSPLWQWKSTRLGSLDALFQWLRLYRALPQEHLRVFSAPSREEIEEQFVRENTGLGSDSITAAQFLCERRIQRPEEGNHEVLLNQYVHSYTPVTLTHM